MEQLLIKGIDGLVKLEKRNGKLGTVVGFLTIAIVVIATISLISAISYSGITSIAEWVEVFFMGATK